MQRFIVTKTNLDELLILNFQYLYSDRITFLPNHNQVAPVRYQAIHR